MQDLEARLVGQWVDVGSPKTSGYIFSANGTVRDAGSDPTNPGSPIEWRVTEPGVIEIKAFGEEGESGGFESYEYTLVGDELSIRAHRNERDWMRYRSYKP